MKNLRVLCDSLGRFVKGDVIPGYAIAQDPKWLVENKHAEWTAESVTVKVETEDLAKSAPDASADLIKHHAALKNQAKQDAETIDALHKKCLELESQVQALSKEVAAKTVELEDAKKARDEHAVHVETLKKEAEDLNVLLKEADKK